MIGSTSVFCIGCDNESVVGVNVVDLLRSIFRKSRFFTCLCIKYHGILAQKSGGAGGEWGEGGPIKRSKIEERMKSEVTAEGMKLLPARPGGFDNEKRKKLWKKKKKMVKEEKKKEKVLFQEVKELVRGGC